MKLQEEEMKEKQIEYGIESLSLEFGRETINNAVMSILRKIFVGKNI